MKNIIANIPAFATMGVGTALLLNGHELEGGFLVLVSVLFVRAKQ